jgi:hypothetical protein
MMGHASLKNFIDVGNPGAPIGSPSWCRASHVELCAVKRRTDHEVRLLKYGLLEFKQKERWRQLYDNDDRPFSSWEDYVQYPEPNGLGMAAESVKAVLEELNDAALLGDVLGQHGGDHGNQYTGGKRQVGNTKLASDGGMTADYIAARLNRDGHAELAAKVRSHKMAADAAAKEVGYRKKLSPFDQLKKLIAKLLPALSHDECEKLRQMLE